MRVLGISGSPRRGGNTEVLLDRVLQGARSAGADTEKLILNELDFKPCQECGGCGRTGTCVIKDDIALIRKKIEKSDCVVISSPIFFCNISAQAKSMIDRFQVLWVRKYVLKVRVASGSKKTGAFLCVSGDKKGVFFKCAEKVIKAFFITLGIGYKGSIFCGGINLKGEIKKRKEVLNKAFNLGAALATEKQG